VDWWSIFPSRLHEWGRNVSAQTGTLVLPCKPNESFKQGYSTAGSARWALCNAMDVRAAGNSNPTKPSEDLNGVTELPIRSSTVQKNSVFLERFLPWRPMGRALFSLLEGERLGNRYRIRTQNVVVYFKQPEVARFAGLTFGIRNSGRSSCS
jgi:hypothetical protein